MKRTIPIAGDGVEHSNASIRIPYTNKIPDFVPEVTSVLCNFFKKESF
jgi:hypothetical protein